MFYELNSQDPLGSSPWKRTNTEYYNGTFEGDVNIFAQITEVLAPDSAFSNPEAGSESTDTAFKSASVLLAEDDGLDNFPIPNVLPDG